MTRMAIVGTSHTVALARAWKSVPDAEKTVDIQFFAAPSPYFDHLTLNSDQMFGLFEPNALPAKDIERFEQINKRRSIDLAHMDHVVVVGYGFHPMHLISILLASDVDGLRESNAKSRISRPAFDANLHDYIQAIAPKPFWQNLTGATLSFVAMPRFSETVVEYSKDLVRLKENPTGVIKVQTLAEDRLEAALLSSGYKLIRQPHATISEIGLTRAEYSLASLADHDRTPLIDEFAHMTPDFGALQMQEILEVLDLQK